MTIDRVIAKLIFDAADKQDDYKARTERVIDELSTYKTNRSNDFFTFLSDRTEQQAYFGIYINRTEDYTAFLSDEKAPNLLPFVQECKDIAKQKMKLELDDILVDFLQKYNHFDESTKLISSDYAGHVEKSKRFINSFEQAFAGKFAPTIAKSIDCVKKVDCQNLITLANARELINLTENEDIALSYEKKIKQLKITNKLLDAYDFDLIMKQAIKLKERETKLFPLTGGSANISGLERLMDIVRLQLLTDYQSAEKTNLYPFELMESVNKQIQDERFALYNQTNNWKDCHKENNYV